MTPHQPTSRISIAGGFRELWKNRTPDSGAAELPVVDDLVKSDDLNSSLEVGPVGADLSLQQSWDVWGASYRRVDGEVLSSETASSPGMAIVLAGRVARAAIGNVKFPSVEVSAPEWRAVVAEGLNDAEMAAIRNAVVDTGRPYNLDDIPDLEQGGGPKA
jgi:hypothetical protein